MKNFTRIIQPTTLVIRGRVAPVFCKIQWEDGRLSITGVEGPLRNGDALGSCGQIPLGEGALSDGWTADMVSRLKEVWKENHLNDMKPGCEHQRAEKWDERPIDASKPLNAYGKFFPAQRSDSWNMLSWITRSEHPEGLLSHPCSTCGYKYGSRWLRAEVPEDVLIFLRSLPEAKLTAAWI